MGKRLDQNVMFTGCVESDLRDINVFLDGNPSPFYFMTVNSLTDSRERENFQAASREDKCQV